MTQAVHAQLVSQPENNFFVRAYRKLWPGWLSAMEIMENMLKNYAIVHTQPYILHASWLTHMDIWHK